MSIPDMIVEVSKRLQRENLSDNIRKKAKDLSLEEKSYIGDKIYKFVKENDVKYLKVIVPYLVDDDDDEKERKQTLVTYMFPKNIYYPSLLMLSNMLKRKCNCDNPEESHKNCFIDLVTEYSILDIWFKHEELHYDDIMASSERIKQLAEDPLTFCSFSLLKENRNEIINWVNTNERLGWTEEPEKRKYFVEDRKFQRIKDVFNPNDSLNGLLETYFESVRNELDTRRKITLLSYAWGLLNSFGTSDGYMYVVSETTTKYYIPFMANKDSLNYLLDAIEQEDKDNNSDFFYPKCRCNVHTQVKNSRGFGESYHKGYLSCNIVLNHNFIGEKYNIVDVNTLKDIISNKCPMTIFNDDILSKVIVKTT